VQNVRGHSWAVDLKTIAESERIKFSVTTATVPMRQLQLALKVWF
jgi:hypothetical protein